MNRSNLTLRRLPLASLILALLAGPSAAADDAASPAPAALPAHAAGTSAPSGGGVTAPTATVRFYTNCDDDGMGSLRQAINASASGDSVRASPTLSCSTITLQSPLIFGQGDLDIRGLGADRTIITAAPGVTDGLIRHLGSGRLNLQFLTLTGGQKYRSDGPAQGGCVYGANEVAINGSRITRCTAKGMGFEQGLGGGVFSAGLTTLRLSEVSGNLATSTGGEYASGGGLYAAGGVNMDGSVVAANEARSTSNSWGGGFTTAGAVAIIDSAIVNNRSRTSGAAHIHPPASSASTITNTTVSGNSALRVGGLTCAGPTTIASSTITANTSTSGESGGRIIGGGLDLGNGSHTITSTIITGNLAGSADFATSINLSASSGAVLGGDHDHISGSTLALPSGTVTTAMSMLPLALNGASRPTHALRATDPDVDAGSAPPGQTYDERGFPFLRTVGSQPDIGAFELDPDMIFRDGVDASIPMLPDPS
jgi:hypothetical protein